MSAPTKTWTAATCLVVGLGVSCAGRSTGQKDGTVAEEVRTPPDQTRPAEPLVCPKYLVACNGGCVNTMTSLEHCGACSAVCSTSQWPGYHDVNCYYGKCMHGTKKNCGDAWADVTSDSNNCGDCGIRCEAAAGFLCFNGKCACILELMTCGAPPVCINWGDPKNCGGCGVVCQVGEVCKGNICLANDPCPDMQRQCNGSCTDTGHDTSNCGACSIKCSPGWQCSQGKCRCAGTARECGGLCIDVLADPNNCGDCGLQCWPGARCGQGRCY
jgi:hypothetical protein